MLVRLTVTVTSILWFFYFAAGLFNGGDAGVALAKATAFALASLAGWLAYLGITRPLRQPGTAYETIGLGPIFMGMPSASMIMPTREPWPFPEMLLHAIARSVFCMAVIALLFTKFMRKRVEPSPDGSPKIAPAPGLPPVE